MKLKAGRHLAYCTNVHRGETWAETFESLRTFSLQVRSRVCPDKPYAIGLRLSHRAAQELADRGALLEFQRWLDRQRCYVFTVNGFPFGRFHGARIKEQVYQPDWTSPERLSYTNLLFDLLAQLVPAGVDGSVSTLPGSFKGFHRTADDLKLIRANLWRCVEHIASASERSGRVLHLGLEPEPLCLIENSRETVEFMERMHAEHPGDPRLARHLGVNYDTCHFAVEYEEPADALLGLHRHGIRISKIHLSSALKLCPTPEVRKALAAFADDVYLHQVIVRGAGGQRSVHVDLPEALESETNEGNEPLPEWRVHFHIPLHCPPGPMFQTTTDHILGVMDVLAAHPDLCSHLEMETYTWDVLPPALKSRDVVEQLVAEYDWTLAHLAERGLAGKD